jgi:O-antigen ligase
LMRATVASSPRTAEGWTIKIIERVTQLSLIVYALCAPHSIAATQGAFLVGALAWLARMIIVRDFSRLRTRADAALFGFFACCVISSFLSYDPLTSIKGLRSPAFFLAFYYVSSQIPSLGFAKKLALILVASCLINVAYSGIQLIYGRGIQIVSIRPDSPLAEVGLQAGDVILEADGQKVSRAADLRRIADSGFGRLWIKFQRKESPLERSMARRAIQEAADLGITVRPGRSFRISGFYSHYQTYAEVLQMIAALAFGLILGRSGRRAFLCIAAIFIVAALIMTSTRAPIAGLALAVVVMSVIRFGCRAPALASLIFVLAMAPAAFLALDYLRGIGFVDTKEGSTLYRIQVWQEALRLIQGNPIFGIGKGSEGTRALQEQYGLYDNDKLPHSHFHSTPLQVAAWWGLPALILYFCFMAIFLAESRKFYVRGRDASGIALGAFGALIAFNFSSLFHSNFIDAEVMMTLWLLVGMSFSIGRMRARGPAESASMSSPKNRSPGPKATSEPGSLAATAMQS